MYLILHFNKEPIQEERIKIMENLFKNNFRSKMPLTNDYVFRSVFGRDTEESRAALIEILNIILSRKNDPIKTITIENPIELGEKKYGKGTVMDIRAETGSGEKLDIEMQTGAFDIYPDRSLYYGGRLVNSSLQTGESYDKMKKSIVVSIVDGKLFSEIEDCHSIFRVKEEETGLLLSDKLEFHFLELEKVDGSQEVSELNSIEKLGAYLKYAGDEDRQGYVQEILDGEEIAMTDNLYRKLTQDEIEYQRMESEFRYELQYNTDMERARKQGLAEGHEAGKAEGIAEGESRGLAKGKAEGKTEGKLEIATAMKTKGLDIETIAELTGLSVEEIEKL